MPLRRWFAERGANHPAAYSMLTLALGMVVCMMIAVSVSISASNRAIRQSEQRSCNALAAELDAYKETPPSTAAGRNLQRAKTDQFRIQHCPEGSKP